MLQNIHSPLIRQFRANCERVMQFAVTAARCVKETPLSILACVSMQHFGMHTGSTSNAVFTKFHKALQYV